LLKILFGYAFVPPAQAIPDTYGMSAFFASTEEKIAVQNLGSLFISCPRNSLFLRSQRKHRFYVINITDS
jgi:hypothetical protein